MIAPALMAAAPLVMSLFGGQKKQVGPEEQFLKLIGRLNDFFGPYMGDISRLAALQGQGLSQGYQAAAGRAGLRDTGVGSVANELANSYSANAAGQARLQIGQLIAQLAAGNAPQWAAQQNQANQMNQAGSLLGRFQSSLGFSQLGGQNPLMDIYSMFAQPKGVSPEIWQIAQTPQYRT